jgi:alkaline phosphatase
MVHRKRSYRRGFTAAGAALALSLVAGRADAASVILLVGDGMGSEQVRAASMFRYGREGALAFERLPHQAMVTTHSANHAVTDSAAGATAMATGRKVNNGVVSVGIPGDGSDLETLLEVAKNLGMSTGLVTTAAVTDATTAAFGAHTSSRSSFAEIARDYLEETRPAVLFGGGGLGMSPSAARLSGYTVVTSAPELAALNLGRVEILSGQFGDGPLPYTSERTADTPNLPDMARTALDLLARDADGLFLVVEGARIDHACHANDLERALGEALELEAAFEAVSAWARGRRDVLLLVTADHETGGLSVKANNGRGVLPTATFATAGHTGVPVPAYAEGFAAHNVRGTLDNTDVHRIMLAALTSQQDVSVGASGPAGKSATTRRAGQAPSPPSRPDEGTDGSAELSTGCGCVVPSQKTHRSGAGLLACAVLLAAVRRHRRYRVCR